jgi:hypothetical protein
MIRLTQTRMKIHHASSIRPLKTNYFRMKIITCYIPPTEGNVKVCGYDILENYIEVRKNVGYLMQ